ncbi:MAG: tRNA adenosine(34) deaminase TadA [Clostridia bacterium]|nr:tRNA adenosine(34) deaminase TadA [Clostridia bacterium]
MGHEAFMREALRQAELALAAGEVPVGAVVVRGDEILARAYNRREQLADPTAHAEILALREAGRKLGGWRLLETAVYVTVEPCAMCAGALIQARVGLLVFGARDPKGGAAGSLVNLVQFPGFNHRLPVIEGVMAAECARLMRDFFAVRRRRQQRGEVAELAEGARLEIE